MTAVQILLCMGEGGKSCESADQVASRNGKMFFTLYSTEMTPVETVVYEEGFSVSVQCYSIKRRLGRSAEPLARGWGSSRTEGKHRKLSNL